MEKTIAFIKSNDWATLIPHGTHNGYVAVPPTNRYYGKELSELDEIIDVHGGLTLSEIVTQKLRAQIIDKSKFLTENTDIGDDWWVFGSDTFHLEDTEINCNRDYVVQETLFLQKQLENGEKI